jgi:hypothetical protein
MPALSLIITNAGIEALANVGELGPVTLSSIALGTGNWAPTAAAVALQAQVATLAAVGSVAASAGMVHITAEDATNAAYTAYEVGIVTSTGVLFAIYSQSTPIFVKSAGSVGLIAADFVISGLPPGSVTVGTATFQYPPATQTTMGVAEIATQAEVNAGTDDTTIVTPLTLHGWVTGNFLQVANNLSDVASAAVSRANLGLGTAAVLNAPAVGNATANQAVVGNDTRLADARNPLPSSVVPVSLSAAAMAAITLAVLQTLYPVGELFITRQAGNPNGILGFGTWVAYGAGKTLVGFNTGDPNFGALDQTGGELTHTLAVGEIPAHSHTFNKIISENAGSQMQDGGEAGYAYVANTSSGALSVNNTGGGGAHNNLQPYITVYFWKRTA